MVHSIKISCSKSSLKDIRKFAEDALNNYEISDVDKNLIVVALDEVCSNLIIHSHNCDSKDFITVQIREKDNVLEFSIIDKGETFNISEYTVPSIDTLIKDKKAGGIGLILVKKIMDKIKIEKQDGFNVCRMYKALIF